MDETPTEEIKAEEGKTEGTAAAAATPPAPPPAASPPTAPRRPSNTNWMLVALIAVSVIALILLATTISLAVVGEHGFNRGGQKFERFEQRFDGRGPMMNRGPQNRGPMMNEDGGRGQDCPGMEQNQDRRIQPQLPTPTPTPTPQTQPAPPSGQ